MKIALCCKSSALPVSKPLRESHGVRPGELSSTHIAKPLRPTRPWFDGRPVKPEKPSASSSDPRFEQNSSASGFHESQEARLEGLLLLSEGLPNDPQHYSAAVKHAHGGWTNLYLEREQYEKARAAASRAAQLDLTFNVAVKWLLIWVSPGLPLRTVNRRKEKRKDSIA